jgi:lysophospholipid acyltransferase (LPLAT)-like uncharacterized protein
MLTASERRGPPPSRGLIDSPAVRRLAGWLIALYIRLVRATNRIIRIPTDPVERAGQFAALRPAIIVSWHANVLAVPLFAEPALGEFVGLASPHADGQLAAATMKALGFRTISGTGASERQNEGTGGATALREMLRELGAGRSVYITAEIPPTPGRRVSMGIIALARLSGRPIVVIAAASSRRTIVERLWDKMQINHPFGRLVLIADGPLKVDESISNEEARDRLKLMLDGAYAEALRRADEPAASRA